MREASLRDLRPVARDAPAARRASGILPGDPGVWVFLTADVSLFCLFFFVFVSGRLAAPEIYEGSRRQLSAGIGLANTLLLLTSSLFVALAVDAARESDRNRVKRQLALAIFAGCGFAVLKITEYAVKLRAGLTITTNDFFAYYYGFTAIHFLHLVIGLGVLAVCLAKARRELIDERYVVWIESSGCYWHMVDLLWIVLFPMLYLLRAA
jgi:nitric oxide reductase NorE protein